MPFDGFKLGGLGSAFSRPQDLTVAEQPADARITAARLSEQRHAASEAAGNGNQNRPEGYWANKVKEGSPQVGLTSRTKPAGQEAEPSPSLGLDFNAINQFAKSQTK